MKNTSKKVSNNKGSKKGVKKPARKIVSKSPFPELIQTKVTLKTHKLVARAAQDDGISVAAWLRRLTTTAVKPRVRKPVRKSVQAPEEST